MVNIYVSVYIHTDTYAYMLLWTRKRKPPFVIFVYFKTFKI